MSKRQLCLQLFYLAVTCWGFSQAYKYSVSQAVKESNASPVEYEVAK